MPRCITTCSRVDSGRLPATSRVRHSTTLLEWSPELVVVAELTLGTAFPLPQPDASAGPGSSLFAPRASALASSENALSKRHGAVSPCAYLACLPCGECNPGARPQAGAGSPPNR
jgi:hypothetical protein